MDAAVAALAALAAFDAGVYATSYRGPLEKLERTVEPVALVATAVGVALSLILPGKWAAVAVLTLLFGRAIFDTLHLGDGNVLEIPLPRDYALYSMLLKVAAAALYILFAFPA